MPAAGPKILLVDDSRSIRSVLTRALASYVCIIFEASNGKEALQIAVEERPQLMILDITMPVMDGEQTLIQFKASPELNSIPVIMLTANVEKENIEKFLGLGAVDYATKSFRPEDFIERIKQILPLTPAITA